jgi:hypothetical protein
MWPRANHFPESGECAVWYVLLALPFLGLLLYPGTEALGIWSDSKGKYTLLLTDIVHGLACWLIAIGLEAATRPQTDA